MPNDFLSRGRIISEYRQNITSGVKREEEKYGDENTGSCLKLYVKRRALLRPRKKKN